MDDRDRRIFMGAGLVSGLGLVMARAATAAPEAATKAGAGGAVGDDVIAALIDKARAAAANAYSPYSKFRVGAAVLTEDGQMFSGCNVENASYGLTICAERNAVFQMVANARQRIRAVAIYTPTRTPTAPCGACRQVINEFGPEALVVSACDSPERVTSRLSALLPGAFGPANLK